MQLLTGITKCLQLITRGADIINETDKFFQSNEYSNLRAASLATRTTLLFLSIGEIALAASNQSQSSAACNMKRLEVLGRFVLDGPLQTIEAVESLANEDANKLEKMKIIEKKIIGSWLGAFRASAELDLSTQQRYRDLPPEEQANLQFPIWEIDDEGSSVIVGYRPFDLKECQNTISTLEQVIPKLNTIEASAVMNVGSKVIGIPLSAFNMLVQRMAARAQGPVLAHASAGAVPAPIQQNAVEEEEEDVFDLCRLNFIPPELEDDPVLSQFICPITSRPIRFVRGDPTSGNRVYYERKAIEVWLTGRQTSPATRRFLLIAQLNSCVPVQIIIDQRLALYSQRIREEILQIGQEVIDQEPIDTAINGLLL